MRNLARALVLMSLLSPLAARADYRLTRPNMLLINPGDLLNGTISVEYERAVATWFGLTAGVSVWAFRGPFSFPGDPSYTALGHELGARFHFIRDAPGGLWIGPSISGGILFNGSDGSIARRWSWGAGASIGYNFIIGRHFTFQIGGGVGFTDYGTRLVWTPRLRLGIGASF